jgi:hypothetical protein
MGQPGTWHAVTEYLRGWGADVVGMFRLRREDRFAILPATLRMTGLLTQR